MKLAVGRDFFMSGRNVATVASRVASVNSRAFTPHAPTFRISHRMVIDVLALFDVGLVMLSAVLAKLFYIAMLLLDGEQQYQPYLVAGLVGGIVLHYVMRARSLQE